MASSDKLYRKKLGKIDLFSNCKKEIVSNIFRIAVFKEYKDMETIIEQNKFTRYIYFVLQGCVYVKYKSHSGKEIFLRAYGEGAVFGEIATFDKQRSNGSFIADGAVVVAALPKKFFRDLCARDNEISYALLKNLTDRTRWLLKRFVAHSTLGAANRVHAELLRLGHANLVSENSAEVKPYLTHSDIAFRVATQREVVSKEFNYLKKQNIIRTTRSCLYIDDMNRLEELVESVTGDTGLPLN